MLGNDQQEHYEGQQTIKAVQRIEKLVSRQAGHRGELKAEYDRVGEFGYTKDDIKWLRKAKDTPANEIVQTLERRMKLARLFGLGIASQLDLFPDRRTKEEQAYEEGQAAGRLRGNASNPYDGPAGQSWQRGFNDGTQYINAELDKAVNGEKPKADLIKSDTSEDESGDAVTAADDDATTEPSAGGDGPADDSEPFADVPDGDGDADAGGGRTADALEAVSGSGASGDGSDGVTDAPEAAPKAKATRKRTRSKKAEVDKDESAAAKDEAAESAPVEEAAPKDDPGQPTEGDPQASLAAPDRNPADAKPQAEPPMFGEDGDEGN